MIENVSTQLTVFHCLCPLPASRKGLRLPLRSALFGEGGSDWRSCICTGKFHYLHWKQSKFLLVLQHKVLTMASGPVVFSSPVYHGC